MFTGFWPIYPLSRLIPSQYINDITILVYVFNLIIIALSFFALGLHHQNYRNVFNQMSNKTFIINEILRGMIHYEHYITMYMCMSSCISGVTAMETMGSAIPVITVDINRCLTSISIFAVSRN